MSNAKKSLPEKRLPSKSHKAKKKKNVLNGIPGTSLRKIEGGFSLKGAPQGF